MTTLQRGWFVRSAVISIVLVSPALAAAPASAASGNFVTVRSAVQRTTDAVVGTYRNQNLSVDVVLTPNNASQMSALVAGVTDPKSANYGHWLAKGRFNAMFAPPAAQVASVTQFLRSNGLKVAPSGASPFLLRAMGSSDAIASAFHTTFRIYRSSHTGSTYFANGTEVQVPAALATAIRGVVGLSDTARVRPHFKKSPVRAASSQARASGCEAPYPTVAQLAAAVTLGTPLPFGYGGAPGCNGLTPSQLTGIYGAPNVGRRGEGAGANVAVFEVSAYQTSDIANYAKTFFGSSYHPPLVDITVDGGPLAPICPQGDSCPPQMNYYFGDTEVAIDIEIQLATAPAVSNLFVYNAPNDVQGLTGLDEYARIANDDFADSVSSSWGNCENDAGLAFADAENLIFQQMALQGQSMFASSGDTGAFGCIRGDGSSAVNTDDPSSQPWVTSVGGTSLESFNPGADAHPSYPASGVETVWNVDNLCNTSRYEDGLSGYVWCAVTGAGGGGTSEFWTLPYYQSGRGLAPGNRHVPDISSDADEFTPFGIYCTGSANTPYSSCATLNGSPNGWAGFGGTSVSAPFWAAVIADRVGYQGRRNGNINPLLYEFYNDGLTNGFLHDITGIGQSTNNNGLYHTTPGYDEATGLGTPKMTPIITNVIR